MNNLTVAVTGASGLVGSHLVEFLSKKGFEVVALMRSAKNSEKFVEQWQNNKVKVVEADVLDPAALRAGLAGTDIVVHAAGVVDPYGSRSMIFGVNVEGTRNTLAAAKAQGVKQFVLVGSLSVITGTSDQYNIGEDVPLRKCGEAYADSKVEAEQLVMAEALRGEITVTVVRPGFIYGPRERSWLPRLINSISQGKAALIDGGGKQTNVIYVENLNRAIVATFLNTKAYGQVYNLTDGEFVSKKLLFDTIADGLKLPRVSRVIPGFLARFFCETISSVAPLLPVQTQRGLARYSRAAFRLAGLNQGFSIAKAERDLGYVDRIPFTQGMAATLATFGAGQEKITREELVGLNKRDGR